MGHLGCPTVNLSERCSNVQKQDEVGVNKLDFSDRLTCKGV